MRFRFIHEIQIFVGGCLSKKSNTSNMEVDEKSAIFVAPFILTLGLREAM